MKFTVVVVTWNGAQWIDDCLQSVLDQEGDPNIILVDNGSSDDTVERANRILQDNGSKAGSSTILRLKRNHGFPTGANRGMAAALNADPDLIGILLLNQDAHLEPGALQAFSQFLEENPKAGALGARILYLDRASLQHAGGYLEHPRMVGLHFGHHEPVDEKKFNEPREVDYVTGAAMMLRAECLRDLGLFEELFSPGYYEDVELCQRLIHNGWSIWYVPEATVIHAESSSFSNRDLRLRVSHRNRLIFALPHFLEAAAAEKFLDAESHFLINDAHHDEVRAISGAALDLLTLLPAALNARIGDGHGDTEGEERARQVLVSLRDVCRDILIPPPTRSE